MFDDLLQAISQHATYGPAVQAAVTAGQPLVLNYHTHGPDTGYCVSICALAEPIIKVLGPGELEELAHIRGFGETEEQCWPLTSAFGAALQERYKLKELPVTYLNGEPAPPHPEAH